MFAWSIWVHVGPKRERGEIEARKDGIVDLVEVERRGCTSCGGGCGGCGVIAVMGAKET